MLNIVIIGAGEVGQYIAALLSKEEHNVILIDKDAKKLELASWNMDVAIRQGSGTDWQLLDDLLELAPDLLIALSGDDEANMVACSIAKHLGYPKTIARVKDQRFLNRTRLDFSRLFDVDYFIAPDVHVAQELFKYLLSPGALAIENFAHGAVQLRTFTIPNRWKKSEKTLKELILPDRMMIGLIRRIDPDSGEDQIIFPHGEDVILPRDEVTVIGEADVIAEMHAFFGLEQKSIRSALIIGGSLAGIQMAKLLEQKKIKVTLIEKNYDRCCEIAEDLSKSVIIHKDGTDIDYLKSEKMGDCDVVIACTGKDDTNLLVSIAGKEIGIPEAIMVLTNTSYAPLLARLGINYTVSPRLTAANQILSQVLTGKINSLISLYENRAEIMEITVSQKSKIVGIPLSELGAFFPKDFLIAMIENRGRIMIANGSRIISPGDTVIVVSDPKHLIDLDNLF